MGNNAFIPRIRFKYCYKLWSVGLISDFFDERTEHSSKGELLSVTIDNGIVRARTLERKDNSSKDKSNYRVVRKNDIAYNSMRMWQGASGRSLYDGIVSPAYTVLSPKLSVSTLFFSYAFKRTKMLQAFQRNSQGLTSDTWNLKFNILKNVKVITPLLEEQEKIADILLKIDNLIVASEKKVFELKAIKKLLLQNIFNQFWRFDGFILPWEQRKVQDLSKHHLGGGTPKTSIAAYWHGDIPWIQSSNIRVDRLILREANVKNYITTQALQKTSAKLIPRNSIAVVTRVGVGKLVLVPFDYVTSQDFISFSGLINDKLFTVYLLYQILNKEAGKVQGTSIKGITKKYLLITKIKIPSDKTEQMKIGRILNLVDHLIVANERYRYLLD